MLAGIDRDAQLYLVTRAGELHRSRNFSEREARRVLELVVGDLKASTRPDQNGEYHWTEKQISRVYSEVLAEFLPV